MVSSAHISRQSGWVRQDWEYLLILGESGQSVVSVGLGEVVTDFDKRGLRFYREREYASPNYYRTLLNDEKRGHILAEMSASESPA
jgi:hypothetical protein